MEEKNNGRGIFYGVIGVATLIVAIIGATFAFFSANASNDAINGQTATAGGLSVEVEKLSTQADGGLIPLDDAQTGYLQNAVSGFGSKGQCVDANDNTVCQVYSITVTNNSTASITTRGKLKLTLAQDLANMRWQVLSGASTINASATTVEGSTDGDIVNSLSLGAAGSTNDSATYYVVIWLHDIRDEQDEEAGKSFSGNVTFNAVDAGGTALSGVTASFTQSS